ncbi:hypothetical protein JCM17961_39460 [Endothiovibrio diazotrophicus]
MDEILDGYPNVAGDLSQQDWGDVSPFVDGDCRSATIGMAVLAVGAPLANQSKAHAFQNGLDLLRFENGEIATHLGFSGDSHILRADEFRFHAGFAILQQHLHDFP